MHAYLHCVQFLVCPSFLLFSGTKRRNRAKSHKGECETIEDDKLETELDNVSKESYGTTENGHEAIVRKRPKGVAVCSNFEEKTSDLPEEDLFCHNQGNPNLRGNRGC